MTKHIETFVFFDLETTGLPWEERNTTKIIELCFLAASKSDVLSTPQGSIPYTKEFQLLLNPEKQICRKVTQMTGLSRRLLKNEPIFSEKAMDLMKFLEDLPKPVCLVAHNGDKFDYKIFNAECKDAGVTFPVDLLCVDSLKGFRTLLKDGTPFNNTPQSPYEISITSDQYTSDEDEFPELNLSPEILKEIDGLCKQPLTDVISTNENSPNKEKAVIKSKQKTKSKTVEVKSDLKQSFALAPLYERLTKKNVLNAHRAKDDCLMLLECAISVKDLFLPWAEKSCITLREIEPLRRY